MKRAFPSLLALAIVVCGTAASSQDAGPDPKRAPVQVFILAGQSNMEGQAVVDLDHEKHYNGGKGTLVHLLKDPRHARVMGHLRAEDGTWTKRDDVWCWYRAGQDARLKNGPLSIGFAVYPGRHHFGPELEFGHVIGNAIDAPVLLLKACWGGKSLHRDFRPPSAGGTPGPYFEKMFEEVSECLENLERYAPGLAGRGVEIAGFVWFQGWNDMFDEEAAAAYEENLVHLIKDVRRRLHRPKLPVVVGETGNGDNEVVRSAQRAATKRPEFAGTTAFVPTSRYRRPAEDGPNVGHGHHWFGNAESYFHIGRDLGEAMKTLLRR